MSDVKTHIQDRRHGADRLWLSFLREWAANPLQTAAIAPSGKALAELITSQVDISQGPVIELGAGTGVFTRALLSKGLRARDLAVIELNARFADGLRKAFPAVDIHQQDAAGLGAMTLFGAGKAGAVISGLGLLSMPRQTVGEIIAGIFAHLRPEGSLFQFTYGWRCPLPPALLAEFDLSATRIGTTYSNLPPATVYRISRRPRT